MLMGWFFCFCFFWSHNEHLCFRLEIDFVCNLISNVNFWAFEWFHFMQNQHNQSFFSSICVSCLAVNSSQGHTHFNPFETCVK